MKKSSFMELQGKEKRKILDVKISMDNRLIDQKPTQQLIEKTDITKCLSEAQDSIILNRLLSLLNLSFNIPTDNRQVYYFTTQGDIFVNCGVTPISQEVRIQLKDINLSQCLHIKLRNIGLLHIGRLMLTQNVINNVQDVNEDSEEEEDVKAKKRCRRTKQRRIGHVIEKVIEWRKFYSGTSDQSRQHEKYSLEQAAKKVGISKKSLDDYLFQIRLGYKFDFNFNEHYNEKVGILRDYVRQKKKLIDKPNKQKKRPKNK